MKSKSELRNILEKAFLALVLLFLGRYLYKNYESFRALDLTLNAGALAAAVFMHFIYKFMQASLWHYITWMNGCAIRWRNAVWAYFYSILGKYIPGKVFMLLARIPAYEEAGVPARKVTVCFFLENICTLLGAAFLFIASLQFFPNQILGQYKGATLALIAAFVVCIHPRVINCVLRPLEQLLKKDLKVSISYPQMLSVVFLFVLNWIVLGFGFYMLTCSIYPLSMSRFLYVSGIFGLSVIIGILAVFAPSGLGVREGIIVLGLGAVMPQEYAVIVSVVSRIWMTLSELSVIGVAWCMEHLWNLRDKCPEDRGQKGLKD